MSAKLTIVFYSTYGTNRAVAEIAAEAARAAGAEVRLRRVPETAPQEVIDGQEPWKAEQKRQTAFEVATPGDMDWASAYLVISPTRFGTVTSQMRAFIDTLGGLWGEGKLANKAASAMTSAQNRNGGQESTLLGLYTTFMHWGAVIVAPGYTDPVVFETGGNPYGFSHDAGTELTDADKAHIRHQVTRLVEMAGRIAG